MSKKQKFYSEILEEVNNVLSCERNYIANTANCSSIMYNAMNEFSKDSVNWFGFYFIDKDNPKQLVLGPFHGKVACTRLNIGRGVCGTSVQQKQTIIVPDVNKFEGHEACDPASKSEIVVPIFVKDKIIGVIDVDSPKLNTFDLDDKVGLEKLAKIIENCCDF